MSNFDKIVSYCSDLLENFPEARETVQYADSRLSKDSQKIFGFGYFPSFKNLPALIESIGEEDISPILYDKINYNIGNIKERHSTFEHHNLIMPYRNLYGEIIGLVGRNLLDDEIRKTAGISKYKNTDFKKGKHLFGLFEAKYEIINKNCVFIVEGQFDCIAAHNKGMKNTVALGSSNMTFEQCALLLRYTKDFILLLDNDFAGQSAIEKINKNFAQYANIKVAKLPNAYKDLFEFLAENSQEDIEISR